MYAGLHAPTQLHDDAVDADATTHVGALPHPLDVLTPFLSP